MRLLLQRDDKYTWPKKDTSWQAWMTVFWASIANATCLSMLYTFGLFVVPLADEFNAGRGDVAWVASIGFLVGGVGGMPSGLLSRHYGTPVCVMAAGICTASGSVMASFANSLWMMYLTFGIFVGLGLALTISSLSAVASWFERYRGIAVGLAGAGSGVGQLVAPTIAQIILDSDGGDNWREAMRFVGMGSGSILFVSGMFIRSRPTDPTSSQNSKFSTGQEISESGRLEAPQETTWQETEGAQHKEHSINSSDPKAQLTLESSKTTSYDQTRSSSRSASSVFEVLVPSTKPRFDFLTPLRYPLSTTFYRCFLAYSICVMIPLNVPAVHIPPWVEDAGEGTQRAASILAILGSAQVVGRIAHGLFADRFGALNGITLAVFINGVVSILWPIVPFSYEWAAVFATVFGLNIGVVITHPHTVLLEHFKCDAAPLVGLYWTIGAPLGLMGPTLAGYIFDFTGSYFGAGFLVGVPFLVSLLLLSKLRLIAKGETENRHKNLAASWPV